MKRNTNKTKNAVEKVIPWESRNRDRWVLPRRATDVFYCNVLPETFEIHQYCNNKDDYRVFVDGEDKHYMPEWIAMIREYEKSGAVYVARVTWKGARCITLYFKAVW